MKKEELRKLRALNATREMMEHAKEQVQEEHSWTNEKEMVDKYALMARAQNLSEYIKIALFMPEMMKKGIKTPMYEIFLNVAGEEYITRELDEQGKEVRWLTAMVGNLKNVIWWRRKCFYLTKDTKDTLNRLVVKNSEYTGLERLQAWQRQILNEEIKSKEEREVAPWDEDMALVPEIPKTFAEWMRRNVCDENYIFYQYEPKGAKIGYCSRCKHEVSIKNPKRNKETTCSRCGTKATFKPEGQISTLSTKWYFAEIIQKTKEGVVTRQYSQMQYYRGTDYRNPKIVTNEDERIIISEDGYSKRYYHGLYKNKYHRWIKDKEYFPTSRSLYWHKKIKLYKKNIPAIVKLPILQKSAFHLWEELPTSLANYIAIEQSNPSVEMLAKIGMFNLAKEMMWHRYENDLLDEGATELAKMLKLDGSRLKRLKEMDGNIDSLKWMQYEKLANTVWPDEMIKQLAENEIGTSKFGFLDYKMTPPQCYRYLIKQAKLSGETIKQTLTTWRDYTCMANQLKMNTKLEQIAKPKDVKVEHDRLVMISRSKGLEKQAAGLKKKWPKVEEHLERLGKFEFADKKFAIVAPKSILDIVTEGTVLNHCVHTCDYYYSRIQTDESYLFFLRRANGIDVPWYTLEVEPSGNIRQKRTIGDNQNEDFKEAVAFLKKWQQFFTKQLTAEEKELGRKSNMLREENYKNLRANGNKVWHGKLAGQLLADVLEGDFMAAVM